MRESEIHAGDMRGILERLGLSQAEAARRLGVDVSTVERWCSTASPTRPQKAARKVVAGWLKKAAHS